MSSSSSLAGARRRRAGGGQAPPPQQQSQNRPPQQQSQNRPPQQQNPSPQVPQSPLVVLQQHHAKINSMESAIRELASKQSSVSTGETTTSEKQQIDLTEISDIIMSRVETTMDFKALYDNDERLVSEIENLQKTVESQQITINSLNTTLHYIIQNLGITNPFISDMNSLNPLDDGAPELSSDENEFVVEEHNSTFPDVDATEENTDSQSTIPVVEVDTYEEENNVPPTFPGVEKSVVINEENNEIKEFSQMVEDEEGSNYDGESNTGDNCTMEIGSVD